MFDPKHGNSGAPSAGLPACAHFSQTARNRQIQISELQPHH